MFTLAITSLALGVGIMLAMIIFGKVWHGQTSNRTLERRTVARMLVIYVVAVIPGTFVSSMIQIGEPGLVGLVSSPIAYVVLLSVYFYRRGLRKVRKGNFKLNVR
jgi:hypothetical protein